MDKYIKITVDTNDADYVSELSKITDEELMKLKPLIEAIKEFKPYEGYGTSGRKFMHEHNYPSINSEYFPRRDLGEKSPEEIYPNIDADIHEMFQDMCPFSEYGFHTVESITLLYVSDIEELL